MQVKLTEPVPLALVPKLIAMVSIRQLTLASALLGQTTNASASSNAARRGQVRIMAGPRSAALRAG